MLVSYRDTAYCVFTGSVLESTLRQIGLQRYVQDGFIFKLFPKD